MRHLDVVLVGRNWITREGLRRVLSDAEINVVSLVDHPDLAPCFRRSDPGTALLILFDNLSGEEREAIGQVRLRCPDAKLVLLDDEFDMTAMVAAFRLGVHGYIVKGVSCDQLIGSLQLIATDQKVMPTQLAEIICAKAVVGDTSVDPAVLDGVHLSDREMEILRCLVRGEANKCISRRLAIAEATVKVHVKAILRKLGLQNRTQAAIWGVANGLGAPACDAAEQEAVPARAPHPATAARPELVALR